MKYISTQNAPKAVGPYSQAIVSNGFIFCSGQIPLDPQTGHLVGSDISAQTHQVLENIGGVLKAAGSSFEQVVKTTCFLVTMEDFAKFNMIYEEYFDKHKPARSTIAVAQLPKGALVEVEVIAQLTNNS